jgi:uncharacterized surface protein with fasciclin (FAS1) repeats
VKPQRTISVFVATGLLVLGAGCGSDSGSSTDESAETVATVAAVESTTTDGVSSSDAPMSTVASTSAAGGSSDTSDASTPTDDTDTSGSTDTEPDPDLDERADDVRAALEEGDFSTMLDLLELSGVADEIEGREVTLLAPTEDAFGELSADELADLVTDVDRSKELIRRHILDELYTYGELAQRTEVTTLSGDTLSVTTDGDTVMIEGARVTPPQSDALAGEDGQEAAVFEIDTLLLDAG